MADNDDVAGPGEPEHTATGEPIHAQEPAPPAPTPVLKTRWRDRAWTFRAMIAVAAASLVIGGVAGGVIAAAAGGDDDHGRMQRWGPGGAMPPGWQGHGPQWRWNDGPGNGPRGPMNPDGNGGGTPAQPPTPSPTPSPTPGSTG